MRYVDPYNPKGSIIGHFKNLWVTNRAEKGIEKELTDFKSFYVDT